MKDLAQKIKELRSRKGYSQEELSERTGLSLRTIQRIENGETDPRGDSLKRLAAVFEVSPDEIVDWTIQEDKGYLLNLNLSALSFLIFPFFGIIIPLIMWISKKDKISQLNELAKDLLSFQITWTLVLFFGFVSSIIRTSYIINSKGDISPSVLNSSFLFMVIFIGAMYLCNVIFIVVNSVRLNDGKTALYFPKIRFLRK